MPIPYCIIVLIFILFLLRAKLRKYFRGAQFTEAVSAKGKIAIVTGGNGGIGSRIACKLNLLGAKVYLFCRNVEKAENVVYKLVMEDGCDASRLIIIPCYLTKFASIRSAVAKFQSMESCLDILINNAGVYYTGKSFTLTEDGHERIWQSNYLGHFLLTYLLLPLLQYAPNGRVINMSSVVNKFADDVKTATVSAEDKFCPKYKTYCRSKLALTMHPVAMTRYLRQNDPTTRVTFNSCHPGCVETDLVRNLPFCSEFFSPIRKFFLKTEDDGAQTPLFLALSDQVKGVSGKYFAEMKETHPHFLAENPKACDDLFNESFLACGYNLSNENRRRK